MSDAEQRDPDGIEPTAPQALIDDLGAVYRARIPVPAEMDEAILSTARSHFARQRRRRLILRLAPVAAAAAAMILLAIPVLRFTRSQARQAAPAVVATPPEDIDGNGRVDILDAFTLARRIDAGVAADAEWDMTGDGQVDAADVDAIAMAAVRVNGG